MTKHLNYVNILVWCVLIIVPFLLQDIGLIDTDRWRTHESNGMISMLTGSFLHGDYGHMVGNLSGMIICATIIYNFYYKYYFDIILLGIFFPAMVMYFFTPYYSVGISGLLFTMVWFIIIRGLMSKDKNRLFIGLALALFYGSSLKEAIPQHLGSNIAWQSHLAGVLIGVSYASWRKARKV